MSKRRELLIVGLIYLALLMLCVSFMSVTAAFIIATLAIIAIYDTYLWRDNRQNNTISHAVYGCCRARPVVGLLLLLFTILLLGHFLVPQGHYWVWQQPVFVTPTPTEVNQP